MNKNFWKASTALLFIMVLVFSLLWAQGPLEVSSLRIGNAGEYITVIFRDSVAWDAASVAANISAENATTITATGAVAGDTVIVTPSALLIAGVALGGCRVSAAAAVSCVLINSTAGALDPASQTVNVLIMRGRW